MKSIVTAAVATALICMGNLSAEATVTQVNNVNDPVNHPFSQNTYNDGCTQQGDCVIYFSPTTATETVITHISCAYFLATGASTVYAELSNNSTGDANFLPVNSYANYDGGANHSMNDNVYLFFQSGQTPRVDVFSSGGPVQNFQCTISGYHK
jgi:hypothetical protein